MLQTLLLAALVIMAPASAHAAPLALPLAGVVATLGVPAAVANVIGYAVTAAACVARKGPRQ